VLAMPFFYENVCRACEYGAQQTKTSCRELPLTSVTVFFAVRCGKRMTKSLCCASRYKAHGKCCLLCKSVSCALCRAFSRKTYGKGFAGRFFSFAVRFRRTANTLFPVVSCRMREKCIVIRCQSKKLILHRYNLVVVK
jgi:hypothetical protein